MQYVISRLFEGRGGGDTRRAVLRPFRHPSWNSRSAGFHTRIGLWGLPPHKSFRIRAIQQDPCRQRTAAADVVGIAASVPTCSRSSCREGPGLDDVDKMRKQHKAQDAPLQVASDRQEHDRNMAALSSNTTRGS